MQAQRKGSLQMQTRKHLWNLSGKFRKAGLKAIWIWKVFVVISTALGYWERFYWVHKKMIRNALPWISIWSSLIWLFQSFILRISHPTFLNDNPDPEDHLKSEPGPDLKIEKLLFHPWSRIFVFVGAAPDDLLYRYIQYFNFHTKDGKNFWGRKPVEKHHYWWYAGRQCWSSLNSNKAVYYQLPTDIFVSKRNFDFFPICAKAKIPCHINPIKLRKNLERLSDEYQWEREPNFKLLFCTFAIVFNVHRRKNVEKFGEINPWASALGINSSRCPIGDYSVLQYDFGARGASSTGIKANTKGRYACMFCKSIFAPLLPFSFSKKKRLKISSTLNSSFFKNVSIHKTLKNIIGESAL